MRSSPRRSRRRAQRPRQPFEWQRNDRSATEKQHSKGCRSLGRDLLWTMSDSRGRRGRTDGHRPLLRTLTDNPGRRRLILSHQFPKRATTSSPPISIHRVGMPTAATPRRLPQRAHMGVRKTRHPRPSSSQCPHSHRAAPRNALGRAIRSLRRPRCRIRVRSGPVSAARCRRQRQPPRVWQWLTCPRKGPFRPLGGKSKFSSGSCRRLCPDPRGPYRTSYAAWGFPLTSNGLSTTCGESGTRSLTDRDVLLARRQQRTLWRVARPWPSG
jgi:hypothetical protein